MILKELQGKLLLGSERKELRMSIETIPNERGLSSPFQVSKELGIPKDTSL